MPVNNTSASGTTALDKLESLANNNPGNINLQDRLADALVSMIEMESATKLRAASKQSLLDRLVLHDNSISNTRNKY